MSLQILFLFGFFQGVILALALMAKSKKSKANRILAILILLLSIQLGLTSESKGIVANYPDLRGLAWTLPYLFAPLTFLYVRSLLVSSPMKWKHLLHLAPFFIAILGLSPYFSLSAIEKIEFDITASSYFFTFAIAYEAIRIVQIIVYAILTISLIKRFKSAAQREISTIQLNWIYQFTYTSLASWVIASLGIVAFFVNLDLPINPFNLVYLLCLIFIYVLGFKILSNPVVFGYYLGSSNATTDSSARYSKSGFKGSDEDKYLKSLDELMTRKQPYLEPEITIAEIAEMLNISKHHFSQLINEKLNKNFFDFVNSYRIEHAKTMLCDPGNNHLKILAIAYDSGFNSKSTFNSLFKKYTGMTPSKYRSDFS